MKISGYMMKNTPAHVCGFSILYGELLEQGRTVKKVVEDIVAKGELSRSILD